MPCSKQKVALAQILQKEGYINGSQRGAEHEGAWRHLDGVPLKCSADRQRTISGLAGRISTSGPSGLPQGQRRSHSVLGGLGVAHPVHQSGAHDRPRYARRNVGGEVLCYVW